MLFHLSSLTGTFGAFESFKKKVFLWVDFNVGADNKKWDLCPMFYVYRVPQKVVLFKLGHHNSGESLVTCPIRICILISR